MESHCHNYLIFLVNPRPCQYSENTSRIAELWTFLKLRRTKMIARALNNEVCNSFDCVNFLNHKCFFSLALPSLWAPINFTLENFSHRDVSHLPVCVRWILFEPCCELDAAVLVSSTLCCGFQTVCASCVHK